MKCNCVCSHLSVVTTSDVGSTLHIVQMEGHQKTSYSMNAGLESDYTSVGEEVPESVRVSV